MPSILQQSQLQASTQPDGEFTDQTALGLPATPFQDLVLRILWLRPWISHVVCFPSPPDSSCRTWNFTVSKTYWGGMKKEDKCWENRTIHNGLLKKTAGEKNWEECSSAQSDVMVQAVPETEDNTQLPSRTRSRSRQTHSALATYHGSEITRRQKTMGSISDTWDQRVATSKQLHNLHRNINSKIRWNSGLLWTGNRQ